MAKQNNHLEQSGAHPGYPIGAVSNLTGISPDTLRVWERRYAVVQPERTASGKRIYSEQELLRLSLIKRLMDAGDSIGFLSELDIPSLKQRAKTLSPVPQPLESLRPCRAVVMGTNIAARIAENRDVLETLEVIGTCSSENIQDLKLDAPPDVVIVELPSLLESDVGKVNQWREQLGAAYVLVIYHFTSEKLLHQIAASRCVPLRAPVNLDTIKLFCQAIVRQILVHRRDTSLELDSLAEPVPAKAYDEEALSRMANISTAIKCECPHHLAELIMSLNAFESYSAQCENQNSKDAALHAYLHHATAQARHIIETALTHLIEVEQIKT